MGGRHHRITPAYPSGDIESRWGFPATSCRWAFPTRERGIFGVVFPTRKLAFSPPDNLFFDSRFSRLLLFRLALFEGEKSLSHGHLVFGRPRRLGNRNSICVAAPNIDPFRLPTLTPAHCCNSKWIQALTACQAGSMLDAGRGSKTAPIHTGRQRPAICAMRP
jgi:hypothetical protein